MEKDKIGHLIKLPMDAIKENVDADPKELCTDAEVSSVLHDLRIAVDNKSYIPHTPTVDNPALSDDYIFDTNDEMLVLKDLTKLNFVGRTKDYKRRNKERSISRYCRIWKSYD